MDNLNKRNGRDHLDLSTWYPWHLCLAMGSQSLLWEGLHMQIELSTTRVHICRGSAILQIHKMDINSSVYRYGVCPWSPRSHDGAQVEWKSTGQGSLIENQLILTCTDSPSSLQAVTSPSFRPFFSPGGEYVHPPLSMASRQTLMEVPQNAISDHIGNSFLSAPKVSNDILNSTFWTS